MTRYTASVYYRRKGSEMWERATPPIQAPSTPSYDEVMAALEAALPDDWVMMNEPTIQLEIGEHAAPYVPQGLPKRKNTNAWRGINRRGK